MTGRTVATTYAVLLGLAVAGTLVLVWAHPLRAPLLGLLSTTAPNQLGDQRYHAMLVHTTGYPIQLLCALYGATRVARAVIAPDGGHGPSRRPGWSLRWSLLGGLALTLVPTVVALRWTVADAIAWSVDRPDLSIRSISGRAMIEDPHVLAWLVGVQLAVPLLAAAWTIVLVRTGWRRRALVLPVLLMLPGGAAWIALLVAAERSIAVPLLVLFGLAAIVAIAWRKATARYQVT